MTPALRRPLSGGGAVSTDRRCGRCGQSDARVLDLDTGGAYHPNADCLKRFIESRTLDPETDRVLWEELWDLYR